MCHEMWMSRRQRRTEEERDRDVWLDFERTRPIADPSPPAMPADPVEAERVEESVNAGR